MTNEFSQFMLLPQLVEATVKLEYVTPTAIQSAVIPLMIEKNDVIGHAQTGSGKTAAFSLPILHNINSSKKHVQALIISPTRELAIQVSQVIGELGSTLGINTLAVYGGQPYYQQVSSLKRGVNVVVGTPGRLLDLIRKKVLLLDQVSTVIIDEADEMLSMGFIDDIEAILTETPSSRQTALFSATIPKRVRELADKFMTKPKHIEIKDKKRTVSTVEQRYYLINDVDRLAALTRLFEVEQITRALVFAKTKVSTNDLASELGTRGFPVEALNGDLNQRIREQVLNRFRKTENSILVATDVAARGLDIDDISHVINYDLPDDPESYIHRIGRTARAGKKGIAISLVTPREKWYIKRIEKFTRQNINLNTLPTDEEIQKNRESKLKEQLMVWLLRGRGKNEKQIVLELIEEGFDPIVIATAALKLSQSKDKFRPILPLSELVPERSVHSKVRRAGEMKFSKRIKNKRSKGKASYRSTSSHERGMVRLVIQAGKMQGIRPAEVVGSIASHARIPGNSIGAIHIEKQHTLIDIPKEYVKQTLAQTGKYKIRKHVIRFELHKETREENTKLKRVKKLI